MADLRHIESRTPTHSIMGRIIDLFNDGGSYTRAQASERLFISTRSFRANVAALNAMGYPIISDGKSFRLANSQEEITAARKRLESAARKIQERVRSLESIEAKFEAFKEGKIQLSFF